MIQRRGRLRFKRESPAPLDIEYFFGWQDLQSDDTIEVGIPRFEHDTHPAFADLLENVEVSQLAAYHGFPRLYVARPFSDSTELRLHTAPRGSVVTTALRMWRQCCNDRLTEPGDRFNLSASRPSEFRTDVGFFLLRDSPPGRILNRSRDKCLIQAEEQSQVTIVNEVAAIATYSLLLPRMIRRILFFSSQGLETKCRDVCIH